ncbi:uncharacterized protein LOC121784199 [Salvia splendens]|uniref:uncharacterized protein LOC121784199 n=1 Tax=Salvia splendens TaxID=180675 RepID=UPI001C272DAD|nr:uncharacterized protein LOC121784199 [Salvia splendens]
MEKRLLEAVEKARPPPPPAPKEPQFALLPSPPEEHHYYYCEFPPEIEQVNPVGYWNANGNWIQGKQRDAPRRGHPNFRWTDQNQSQPPPPSTQQEEDWGYQHQISQYGNKGRQPSTQMVNYVPPYPRGNQQGNQQNYFPQNQSEQYGPYGYYQQGHGGGRFNQRYNKQPNEGPSDAMIPHQPQNAIREIQEVHKKQRAALDMFTKQLSQVAMSLGELRGNEGQFPVTVQQPAGRESVNTAEESNAQERVAKKGRMVETEKMVELSQPKDLPPKRTDPGVFTLPISVRDVLMGRAMCDLGASINIMPHSMYKKLGKPTLVETNLEIQLADVSCIYPEGVLENEIVKVNKFMYLTDFFVIKMTEPEAEESVGILLGRPFLSTAGTVIDVRHGKINLEFNEERLTIDIHKVAMKPQGRESIQSAEAVRSLKQEDLEKKIPVDSTNDEELKREAAYWSKEIIQSEQIAKPLDQAASSSIQLRKNPSPTEQLLPLSGSPVTIKSLTSLTYHEHVKPNLLGQKWQSRKKLRPGEEGVKWKTAYLMEINPKLHLPPAIIKKGMIDPTLRREDFMMGQEELLFQCQLKLIPKK